MSDHLHTGGPFPAEARTPSGPVAWSAAFDALPDPFAILDGSGLVVAVNEGWREFARLNGGMGVDVGADYLGVCRRAAAEDVLAAEVVAGLQAVLSGARASFECVYPCHAPGRHRYFRARFSRITRTDPDAVGAVAVVHTEVTEQYAAQQRAYEAAGMLDSVDAAVIATDVNGTITLWSEGAEALYGWAAYEVIGKPITSVTVGPQDEDTAAQILEAMRATGSWEGEFEVVNADGRRFPAYVRNRLLRDCEGEPTGFVGVSVDMSERVQSQRRLAAAHDFLTTVMNTLPVGLYVLDRHARVLTMNRVAEQLLGYAADELAGRLMHDITHHTRPDGTPHLLADCPITKTRETGEAVTVENDVFVRKDGTLLPVAYSAAPFLTETGDQGFVVVFADVTERRAREERLSRRLDQFSWLGRIQHALEREHLELYAQPIVDLASGETVQHELLLRMISADGMVIPPGAFLPAAEELRQMREIDRWVISKSMGYASMGCGVEINISAQSLGDRTLPSFVRHELKRWNVDPALVVFEITETALVGSEAVARLFVEDMRRLGCGVALDDFGTGYASFHYLKSIPVSILKIDQEFVRDLDGPDRNANLHVIRAVVALAAGLGMKTVAEGVETQAAYDQLIDLGVDCAQGYLLGRPVPADQALLVPHPGEGGRRP